MISSSRWSCQKQQLHRREFLLVYLVGALQFHNLHMGSPWSLGALSSIGAHVFINTGGKSLLVIILDN